VITHDHEIAGTLQRRVELRDGRLVHDEPAVPA
jgi:ABC-type lipoprotein export system ATPase subunit